MLDGQHIVSAGDARLQTDPHIGAYFRRFFENIHFVQHLFTALGALDGFFPVEDFSFAMTSSIVVDSIAAG